MTSSQLHAKTHKVNPMCVASLNMMRIAGVIKGKRTGDKAWVCWIEDMCATKLA